MYCRPNFPTKKALKEAVKNGKPVTIFQPGPFGGDPPIDGNVTLEGPHYPQPHKWYVQARTEAGLIVSVK